MPSRCDHLPTLIRTFTNFDPTGIAGAIAQGSFMSGTVLLLPLRDKKRPPSFLSCAEIGLPFFPNWKSQSGNPMAFLANLGPYMRRYSCRSAATGTTTASAAISQPDVSEASGMCSIMAGKIDIHPQNQCNK